MKSSSGKTRRMLLSEILCLRRLLGVSTGWDEVQCVMMALAILCSRCRCCDAFLLAFVGNLGSGVN